MDSILMSDFNKGLLNIKSEVQKLINKNTKVTIIPWSFAQELETKNINEFFNEKRRNKYLNPLLEMGLDEKNVSILDCYNHETDEMIERIKKSDILILTGGNPEMFYKKVMETKILDVLKEYKNTIIGVSAGAELQLKKYFITKKNNYYKKFAFYDGFGIIDNNFYFDVHSVNRGCYLKSLKEKSIKYKKDIYCLFENGVIIYNRQNKRIKTYGEVMVFDKY